MNITKDHPKLRSTFIDVSPENQESCEIKMINIFDFKISDENCRFRREVFRSQRLPQKRPRAKKRRRVLRTIIFFDKNLGHSHSTNSRESVGAKHSSILRQRPIEDYQSTKDTQLSDCWLWGTQLGFAGSRALTSSGQKFQGSEARRFAASQTPKS